MEQFKRELNNWGTLEWLTETPSKQTTFLDLHLQLRGTTMITNTHQKDLNLYLYIPPTSAHPPSCLKGLIAGEMRRYWFQNDTDDFQAILTKFITWLTDRGHRIEDLIPLFQQAALAIDSNETSNATTSNSNTLLIHWRYHPFDIQRSDLRSYYNKTLEQLLDYFSSKLAISLTKCATLFKSKNIKRSTPFSLSHVQGRKNSKSLGRRQTVKETLKLLVFFSHSAETFKTYPEDSPLV